MISVNINYTSNQRVSYFVIQIIRVILLIMFCFIFSKGQAQNSRTTIVQPKVVLPFEYDGRIVIPIKINGSEELDIIFDSGISQARVMLLMHKEMIEKLKLKIVKTVAGGRGVGSGKNTDIHISMNNQISLDKLIIKKMMIAVMDQKIDSSLFHNSGVIGNALLLDYVVEIDFNLNEFKLYDSESFVADDTWEELSIELEKNLPVIKTVINIEGKKDIPVKLILDTGGRGGLILVTNSKMQLTKPNNIIYKLSGTGLRGAVYGDHSRIARTKFGSHFITGEISSWIPISDVPILEEISGDGAIGIDFLRRFNLVFDYRNKRVLIKPNINFNKISDINMAGLSIVEMGSGERIIFHVIKGSQAFKKRIKKGDELIKINGASINSLNMFEVEELFKKNRKKISIEYLREGKIYKTKLKLKRII
jgi:PDZ domain/Aspartyl protease